MRDDHRQRVRVAGADVDVVDVKGIDPRLELRECVQPRLGFPPLIVRSPVANELLQIRELHALRLVRDSLFIGPACRCDAAAEIGEGLVRHLGPEWSDGLVFRRRASCRRLERAPRLFSSVMFLPSS